VSVNPPEIGLVRRQLPTSGHLARLDFRTSVVRAFTTQWRLRVYQRTEADFPLLISPVSALAILHSPSINESHLYDNPSSSLGRRKTISQFTRGSRMP
jgi:hypothetical protein